MQQQTETTFEEKKNKFHCLWHFVPWTPGLVATCYLLDTKPILLCDTQSMNQC